MAKVEVYNITDSGCSVKLTELQAVGYERRVVYQVYDADTNKAYKTGDYINIPSGSTSGGVYSFSGLTENHGYFVLAVVERSSDMAHLATLYSDTFYTDTGIEPWSWTSSNGSASASQTTAAYNAVYNKTETTNFSYKVWNDMVDKVSEILSAKGKTWDATYASYANTKMSSSSKTLKATMFNSLRNNIELAGASVGLSKIPDGYTSGKVPHPVYSIDAVGVDAKLQTVYGHYFTTLTTYMNSCINKL